MEVTNAIEARAACDAMLLELNSLPHNPDLKKLLRNLDAMVTNLSRIEVIARRGHGSVLEVPLKDFNKALNHLNNLILVARLVE